MFLLREEQASHVLKRSILGTVFQRDVGRLTNPLSAKVMANQLRIVQLKVRLEDTGRRSTKERVNGKSSGANGSALPSLSSQKLRFDGPIKTAVISGKFPGVVIIQTIGFLNPLY